MSASEYVESLKISWFTLPCAQMSHASAPSESYIAADCPWWTHRPGRKPWCLRVGDVAVGRDAGLFQQRIDLVVLDVDSKWLFALALELTDATNRLGRLTWHAPAQWRAPFR